MTEQGVAVTPQRFRTTVLVAWLLLAIIVFSGAAVRLTESGLGCEDWPTCSEDRLAPEWSFHGWVEFGNRLLSAVVGLAVAAVVVAAYRRRPRRRDLIRWSWGLVAGVVAQVVLGGLTVLADLHPSFVIAHFLLSIVLLWNVIVLWDKASGSSETPVQTVTDGVVNHSRLVVGLATLTVVAGTVVTGTGPNSGDSRADRLALDLESVVRVHSVLAWGLVVALVALAVRLGPRPGTRMVLVGAVVQGGIGYLQYALGVPPFLVWLHVIGAVVVWSSILLHHLSLFERRPEPLVTRSDAAAGVRQT